MLFRKLWLDENKTFMATASSYIHTDYSAFIYLHLAAYSVLSIILENIAWKSEMLGAKLISKHMKRRMRKQLKCLMISMWSKRKIVTRSAIFVSAFLSSLCIPFFTKSHCFVRFSRDLFHNLLCAHFFYSLYLIVSNASNFYFPSQSFLFLFLFLFFIFGFFHLIYFLHAKTPVFLKSPHLNILNLYWCYFSDFYDIH